MEKPSQSEIFILWKQAKDRLKGIYRWTHIKTGKQYIISGIALRENNLVPVVIYEHRNYHTMWTRPLDEFLEKFQPIL